MTPAVGFGMTLHNKARHLPDAIESLLAQTDGDFGLLLLDDGSTDETEAIARDYASRDPRIRFERHPSRGGMVQTWRDAVDLTVRHFPDIRYFAWASDHDRWHPEWLARTRAELEAHPEAVLAYSRNRRIDDAGQLMAKQPKTFDTAGLRTARERWLRFSGEAAGAGDLVYGLMRIDALRRAGVFRPVMLPDRLLMLEMTLQGEFRQVPEELWFRRQAGPSSVVRQRISLFTPENAPGGLWLPPWIQHAVVLWRTYVASRRPEIAPADMAALIVRYQALYLLRQHSKSRSMLHAIGEGLESLHQLYKEARSRTRWALDDVKVAWFRWRGQTKRKWRRFVFNVAVARRRARARVYELRQAVPRQYGRLRRRSKRRVHKQLVALHAWRVRMRRVPRRALRAAKRGLYHTLVLTHRLGLRGNHDNQS